jgi:acyl-CoA synthetase (AMP-forming)/AMP-acid ligase II
VTPIEWESLLARPPDDVVAVAPGGACTRAELERAARAVAAQLAGRGTGRGDAVVIALPNSIDFVATALAARLCGAAVVNVPSQWRREIVTVADEAEAPVVVLAPGRLSDPALTPLARRVLQVDLRGPAGRPQPGRHDPEHPAWLAYSSGTTGRPKGAVHTEVTVGLMTRNFIERYDLGPADRILVAAPLGHAVGYVYGLQLALAAGATMVLLKRWDVAAAVAAIERHRCTFFAGPTPFLADVVEHADAGGGRALSSLRYLLCGGAPVPLALLRRARTALPGTLATAYYGSSECGGVCTCPPDAPAEKVLTTDGRPLPGMEVRIEASELMIRGTQLARGYRGGDPEARFRADGWFATGDEASVDADGWVRIGGRLTDLIRRGGVAVAPTEVEEVLAEHAGVREVAVIGIDDPRLGERVVAVVVPTGSTPRLEALRALCERSGLAKVKWPESVVGVQELPRSASGKLARRDLRAQLERSR